jgi:hypothetical protein
MLIPWQKWRISPTPALLAKKQILAEEHRPQRVQPVPLVCRLANLLRRMTPAGDLYRLWNRVNVDVANTQHNQTAY